MSDAVGEAMTVCRIHLRIAAARARAQAQYRASFWLQLAGNAAMTTLDFAEIAVIFGRIPLLAGWSLAEVALLYGLANVALSTGDLLVGSVDELNEMVRAGTFDTLLLRPLGSLLSVCSSEFVLRRLGRVSQAVVVLAVALVAVHVRWTAARVLLLGLTLPSGTAIFIAIWVTGAAVTFWTVDTMEMTNAFTYGGGFVASYPLGILAGWMRRLFVLAVPLAFVSYYPALALMGRPDPLHAPAIVGVAGPLVAIVSCVVAGAVWRAGVRRHRSTGT